MKLSKGLKIAALVVMGLLTVFLLFMGFGEIVSGDYSGMQHLIPAVVIMLMMWAGWKKPFVSGIAMCVLGLVTGVCFFNVQFPPSRETITALIIPLPIIVSGLLLLAAGLIERSNKQKQV
jgi:hypothetical protein